jgi:hypothetical protein
MNRYQVLFDNIVAKWERITGRTGSFWYTAPETSSTVSLGAILIDLEKRVGELENLDKKKPTGVSAPMGEITDLDDD